MQMCDDLKGRKRKDAFLRYWATQRASMHLGSLKNCTGGTSTILSQHNPSRCLDDGGAKRCLVNCVKVSPRCSSQLRFGDCECHSIRVTSFQSHEAIQ